MVKSISFFDVGCNPSIFSGRRVLLYGKQVKAVGVGIVVHKLYYYTDDDPVVFRYPSLVAKLNDKWVPVIQVEVKGDTVILHALPYTMRSGSDPEPFDEYVKVISVKPYIYYHF